MNKDKEPKGTDIRELEPNELEFISGGNICPGTIPPRPPKEPEGGATGGWDEPGGATGGW